MQYQLSARSSVARPAFAPARAAPNGRRRTSAPHAEASGANGKGGTALSEDMIARLRAAEEEAARLKAQLAELQAGGGAVNTPTASKVLDAKPQRIDGTGSRETLFSGPSGRSSWLSEEDVDWITGGGPSEASASSGPTDEQQGQIRRRVLVGGAATAALAAFALVPTKDLRLKPPRPLFFYLAALLRVEGQLGQVRDLAGNADWPTLRLVLPRITGPPGDAKAALYDAIALLPDRSVAARAEDVAGDFLESLGNVDAPRRYYDAMPTRTISGQQNAEFVRFSLAALARAQLKLAEFLRLMPRDALAAAREAVAAEAEAEQ